MRKHLLLLGAFYITTTINAQSNITSSSKNISETSGSVNYSIGQVFYQSQNSNSGAISTGVQIPVETLTLSIEDDILLHLSAKVYPNPTVNDVVIKIDNLDNTELSYQLFTVNGKSIYKSNKIQKASTKILMKHLPANMYLLQIKSKNQLIKTFKIIKNQ